MKDEPFQAEYRTRMTRSLSDEDLAREMYEAGYEAGRKAVMDRLAEAEYVISGMHHLGTSTAAFNECHLSVREYVDQMLVKGILKQQREAREMSKGKADRPLWEKHKEEERQALIAALAERSRLDPDAPDAIVIKDAQDNSQLRNTQNALSNLYKAVQKSRAVNDPLGMATAMEEAGKWF